MQHLDEGAVAEVTHRTQAWLERAVIGLNLCPFAKAVHVRKQVRFSVSGAETPDELLEDLTAELDLLHRTDPELVDTTLLIHPSVLTDFLEYNDFLGIADAALEELCLQGILQIASFHPEYQFADASPDDITNYTNRSPYPILHLLREASVERAVDVYPDAETIYERNIVTMRHLGVAGWKELMQEPKE